jgi:hypothetical protein
MRQISADRVGFAPANRRMTELSTARQVHPSADRPGLQQFRDRARPADLDDGNR